MCAVSSELDPRFLTVVSIAAFVVIVIVVIVKVRAHVRHGGGDESDLLMSIAEETRRRMGQEPVLVARRKSTATGCERSRRPKRAISADLKAKVDSLVLGLWGNREALKVEGFELSPALVRSGPAETVATAMLRHARKVARGAVLPWGTPPVAVRREANAAGLFCMDGQGWAHIEIDPELLAESGTRNAVLAHELCHLILRSVGISEEDEEENERLTDAAIFVCGFGRVFLAGYRGGDRSGARASNENYRLGYLTDAEYASVSDYVRSVRETGGELPSLLEDREMELRVMVWDEADRRRLLEGERRRCPSCTEKELLRRVIDRLRRDL